MFNNYLNKYDFTIALVVKIYKCKFVVNANMAVNSFRVKISA
jgi:hypothetical protein